MIRERVSTSGIIRPLEPEGELTACKMPHDHVAQVTEEGAQRYIKNKQRFDQQFEHTLKSIDKDRRRNLAMAKEDTIKRVTVLQQSISKKRAEGLREADRDDVDVARPQLNLNASQSRLKFDQRVLSSPGWAWSWVLDDLENPPPSSIVARRDTEEARQLAAIADWATRDEDHAMSANNLWNVIQNFLTAAPANGNVLMKPHRSTSKWEKIPTGGVEGHSKK
jgi:non-ribosomal peptide synthetase component F